MSAPVLGTSHNAEDEASKRRAAHNRALRDELWARVAEAALGGRVRLFFDRAAVRAAATLNGEARELLEVALDLGATAILCQTGLAAAGLAADTLDARFEMGGLVDLLAHLDDDRLIVA